MSSCEGCGTKNGCTCPESLESDLARIAELEQELARNKKALALCIGQRNMVHAEECDDVKCMIGLDAQLAAVLEGK